MKEFIKKYGIYFIVAIVSFAIVALCMYLGEKNKVSNMLKKFDNAYNDDEARVIFYASATCHFCETEKPIVKQIAKDYDLDIVELDVSLLTKSQREDINKKLKIEGATPTTSVVKNKEVLYTHVGYLDGQDYVDFLVEAGILKEGSKYKPEENLKFIGYKDLVEVKDGVVVFGYTSDQDCNEIKKIMNNISKKYDIDIYYYNFGKLNEEDFYASFDYIEEINTNNLKITEDDKFVFPVISVIENGEIVKIIDESKEDKIVKALGL